MRSFKRDRRRHSFPRAVSMKAKERERKTANCCQVWHALFRSRPSVVRPSTEARSPRTGREQRQTLALRRWQRLCLDASPFLASPFNPVSYTNVYFSSFFVILLPPGVSEKGENLENRVLSPSFFLYFAEKKNALCYCLCL